MQSHTRAWRVLTFGRFAVELGDADVTPAGIIPARAVKYLAVVGHPVHYESLADVLWPNIDAALARTRLRNVVARVRAASGELIQRSGDVLSLHSGVVVDLWRFQDDAMEALTSIRSDPLLAERSARRALRTYSGELLPGDIYADWSQPAREHVRRLAAALLDVVAGRAADATSRPVPVVLSPAS